jgi:PleD family two-component response regulator
MADSRKGKKQPNLKISELILSGKSLAQQISRMKKDRFLREQVVDLNEFRKLREELVKKTVLIVDSDEDTGSALAHTLEREGYGVLRAGDASALALVIENHNFDLVVFELGIAGVNGFDFCRLLKGNQLLRKIPLVFLSRRPSKDQSVRAFKAGGDDYIAKPFEMDRLLKTLKYFLENG